MALHQKSKACRLELVKSKTITSFRNFFTQPAANPVPTAPTMPPGPLPVLGYSLPIPAPMTPTEEAGNPASTSSVHGSASDPTPLDPCILLLREVRALARRLPETVPIAIPSDGISGLGADGATYAEQNGLGPDTSNDAEDHLSHALHLVWGKSDEDVRGLIRRGPSGVEGYCKVLEYFIAERGASGELIAVRVERIKAAVIHL